MIVDSTDRAKVKLFELSAAEPPRLSLDQACKLVNDHYGLVSTSSVLSSERDQNFRMSTPSGQFLFKVFNQETDPEDAVTTTRMMRHLERHAPDLPVPRIKPTLAGDDWAMPAIGPAAQCYIQLQSWLSGSMLGAQPVTPDLRRALGATSGRLTRALSTINVTTVDRTLIWDCRNLPRLRSLVELVGETETGDLIVDTIDRFEVEVVPRLSKLPIQLIHNDFNPSNTLIDEQGRICGVLDFGDSINAPAILDLAVTASYYLSAQNPLEQLHDLIEGYRRERGLSCVEAQVLPLLIEARLCLTVLITSWRATKHPQNRDYICRNRPRSVAAMRALSTVPRQAMSAMVASHVGEATHG